MLLFEPLRNQPARHRTNRFGSVRVVLSNTYSLQGMAVEGQVRALFMVLCMLAAIGPAAVPKTPPERPSDSGLNHVVSAFCRSVVLSRNQSLVERIYNGVSP